MLLGLSFPPRQNSCRRPDKLIVAEHVQDESGIYRVVYTARLEDAVYVLHAFQKKTQTTSKRDIELAAKRYNDLMRGKP